MNTVVSWFIGLPEWDREAVRLVLVVTTCFAAMSPVGAVLLTGFGRLGQRWRTNALICVAVALYSGLATLVIWFSLSVISRQNIIFFEPRAEQDHWVVILAAVNALVTLVVAYRLWRRRDPEQL
jgi:hypothetical protein